MTPPLSLFQGTTPTAPTVRWGVPVAAFLHVAPLAFGVFMSIGPADCPVSTPCTGPRPPVCEPGNPTCVRLLFVPGGGIVETAERDGPLSVKEPPPRIQTGSVTIVPGAIVLDPLNDAAEMAPALAAWGANFGIGDEASDVGDMKCSRTVQIITPTGHAVPGSDEPVPCESYFAVSVVNTAVKASLGVASHQRLFALFPLAVEEAIYAAVVEAAKSRLATGTVQIVRAGYRLDAAKDYKPVVPVESVEVIAVTPRSGGNTSTLDTSM